MVRSHRRSIGRSAKRRKLTWEISNFFGEGEIFTDGTSLAVWVRVPAGKVDTRNSLTNFIVPPDCTLVRTRVLNSAIASNGAADVTHVNQWSFGLIAWDGVSDDPADLGTLPHPFYDGNEDWLFRSVIPSTHVNLPFSNGISDLDGYQSRAQRKLSNGTGILAVWGFNQPFVLGHADAVSLWWMTEVRMLLKEP